MNVSMKINIIDLSRLAVLLLLSAFVSACSGAKVIQTVDDSADYKSATSLPPLNKRLNGTKVKTKAEVVATDKEEAKSTPQPTQKFISSELITVDENTTRLLVELPVDEALTYLADKLVASGVTVHHRNLQAGRISIGCGDIESSPSIKKKSRWVFSGRREIGRLDYCVLELNSDRRGTVVKVLDLNQEEVKKSAAEGIFQGILVN